jgi:hypothetical protein
MAQRGSPPLILDFLHDFLLSPCDFTAANCEPDSASYEHHTFPLRKFLDWECCYVGHKRPTGMMSIFGALAFHCHYEAEGGAHALSEPAPRGRGQGALCFERPFLTSTNMELRVPQVRHLPLCISRVRTTHKFLALCEGRGHPCPLIFARAICATHAHSPSARSTGFCVIWVCISSRLSSWYL